MSVADLDEDTTFCAV